MTPKHWIRMAMSALCIFVVGLVITRAVSAGGRKIGDLVGDHMTVEHSSDVAIPMDGVAFKMQDNQLGNLEKLSVLRNGPADVRGLHFTIRLNKGITADRFANCELVLKDPSKIDKTMSFGCVAEGDAGYDELTQFGTITFLSEGKRTQTHRFEVPQSFVESLHSAAVNAMAANGSGDVKAESNSDGHFQVVVNGQKVVEIDGDNAGGSVVVRDPTTGAKVVDINGNDAGGNVVIKDAKTGANVLEIHGTDAGGSVKVNGVTQATTVKPAKKVP